MGKRVAESAAEVLVTSCNKHKLSPKKRKGIEVLLQADPYTPYETLAQEIGVTRKTLWEWRTKDTAFQAVMAEVWGVMVDVDWVPIVYAQIQNAKKGDLAAAKWLGEMRGHYQPKGSWGGNEVHVNVNGNGHASKEEKEEIEEFIRDIRAIKTQRARTARAN